MRPIRVAMIASTLATGGAEHVTYDLLSRLSRDRFETELFFLRSPGHTGERLIQLGIHAQYGFQYRRLDPTVWLRLARRLRQSSPDIVFLLEHHNAIFWGGLASVIAGVPHRVLASHTTRRSNNRPTFSRSDRFMIHFCDAVVAVSPSHADYLATHESVDRDQLTVIENGIDIERYQRPIVDATERRRSIIGDGAEPVVMIVAALRPEKAHEALLEAAVQLRGRYPKLRVLIVGDGPCRVLLETMVRQMDLGDTVVFLGRRDDVAELLPLSDVLVLPSRPEVETLPLAVLEAMAAGVPVVASAVGSLPDMIEDRVNGRLIAPADPKALAQAIRDTIEQPEATARMVQSARATVAARYSAERMATQYEALFERIARS